MRVIIDNRIRFDSSQLDKSTLDEIKSIFRHNNPDFWKAKRKGFYTGNIKASIETWDCIGPRFSIPRGGWSKFKKILKDRGYDIQVSDRRFCGEDAEIPLSSLNLYGYQEEVVTTAIEKQNCIILSGTGSGKTRCALSIISRLGVPALIVVNSDALAKQWIERITAELGCTSGRIQGKKFDLQPVMIAMLQTLRNLDDVGMGKLNAYFGCLICDELQFFAADTFYRTIDKFKSKYRFGFSADHTRKDRKEFLVEDIFGQVAVEIDQEKLVRENVVMEVAIRLVETVFEAPWYLEQQKAQRLREAGLGPLAVLEEFRLGDPDIQLKDIPQGQPDYNRLLVEITTDKHRNDQIIKLTLANKDRTVVILTQRIDHCHLLREQLREVGVQSGLLIGGSENAAEFKSTVEGLKSGQLHVGIGTISAFGTGINLPNLDRGIIAVPVHGNRQLFGQVRGRFCRTAEDKQQPILYYLYDSRIFGKTPVKNLSNWNRNCMVNGISAKEYLRA